MEFPELIKNTRKLPRNYNGPTRRHGKHSACMEISDESDSSSDSSDSFERVRNARHRSRKMRPGKSTA